MPENCILCPIFQGTPLLHFHSSDHTFAQVHYSVSCYHLGKKGNIPNVRLVTVHRPVVDLRGHERCPQGSIFFQFHAVLGGNLAKLYVGTPSGGLAPTPLGNDHTC